MIKFLIKFLLIVAVTICNSNSEVVKKIEILGNERITDQSIEIFNPISVNDDIDVREIDLILKKLYETNFFKDVNVSFKNNILTISVVEFPIIQNVCVDCLICDPLISGVFKTIISSFSYCCQMENVIKFYSVVLK